MCYANLNNHKRPFQTQSMRYHYFPSKEPPHFPSSGLSVLPLTHTFQGLAESFHLTLCEFISRRFLSEALLTRAWRFLQDATEHTWAPSIQEIWRDTPSLKIWYIVQKGQLHNRWAIAGYATLSEAVLSKILFRNKICLVMLFITFMRILVVPSFCL